MSDDPSTAGLGGRREAPAPGARPLPTRSRWIPIIALLVVGGALLAGLISLAVGEGPTGIDVEGGNEAQRLFGGLPQSGALLGDEMAPVRISVFNDLQCVACAEWQLATVPTLVEDLVRPRDASLEFRNFAVGPKQIQVAAFAATAAGEQDAEWQYAHIFFANVDKIGRQGVTDEVMNAVAAAVPHEEFDVMRWEQDRDSPAVVARVEADAELATELRLPAEPAVVVDGPGGTERLTDSPSLEQIEAAVQQVSGSSG